MSLSKTSLGYILSSIVILTGAIVLIVNSQVDRKCFDSNDILCKDSQQCPSTCSPSDCFNLTTKLCSKQISGNPKLFQAGFITIIVGTSLLVLTIIMHVIAKRGGSSEISELSDVDVYSRQY